MKNKKIIAVTAFLSILFLIAGIWVYKFKGPFRIETVEKPEEVVRKFYAYIAEGGSSSLNEAYRLISSKHFVLTEDKFKGIVLNYPKNMNVKIIDGKVKDDRAVVTIEYSMPSSFGGEFTSTTEINLDLDEKSKSWRIDFTGETYGDTQKG